MARQKSEFLSAASIALGIFKALTDAVLRAGGNDQVLREVEDPTVADKLAAILMAEAGQQAKKPQPNLDGLSEVFEVEVGGRIVRCAWIPRDYFASDPSNQEVMDEIARRHLRCPASDDAIAAFDAKKAEMVANPSVAIDGQVQLGAHGDRLVGDVFGYAHGRYLYLHYLDGRWSRCCRFLVVLSE